MNAINLDAESRVMPDDGWHAERATMTTITRAVADWYRPRDLDGGTPVGGGYEVSDGEARAVLIKEWDDDSTPEYLLGDQVIPLLYGHLPHDRRVTMVDLRLKSGGGIGFGSPLTEAVLRASYGVEGVWLAPEQLSFTELRVSFWDQQSWTDWEGFTANFHQQPRSIVFASPAPICAHVGEATITLRDASRIVPDGWPDNGYRLNSGSEFHIAFDQPVSFKEMFAEWLVPLEFLILTCTGRTSGLERLQVFNPAWGLDRTDEWPVVHRPFAPRPERSPDWYERLHRLSDLDFARQIPLVYKAFRASRYSANQYAGLRSGGFNGLIERFTAAAQLAESFDRHLHQAEDEAALANPAKLAARAAKRDEVEAILRAAGQNARIVKKAREAFRDPEDPLDHAGRLRRLDREAGHVVSRACALGGFDPDKGEDWAGDLAALRNIVIHGTVETTSLFKDGQIIHTAYLIYVWLYEAAWLNAIGFDHATIDERIMIRVKRRIDIVEAAHMTIRTLVDNYRARRRGPATMSPTATEA